jgi:hypothetical protein
MPDYTAFMKELQEKFGSDAEKYMQRWFQLKYGTPIDHAKISSEKWTISRFRKDELESQGIIYGNNGNLIQVLDKIEQECNDNPNTSLHRLQYEKDLTNILLLLGLTESAKRDTGETSTTIDWIGTGTSATAEDESQAGLISAYGSRKQFSVSGQRKVINQTAKYNMVFSDTDLTVPVNLTEGATYTLSSGGIAHARLNFPSFPLTSGEVITFQINETHQNG